MPSSDSETHRLAGHGAFGGLNSEKPDSAPETADDFARRAIFTICCASVTPAVGRRAYERCMRAIAFGSTARIGFRHQGKSDAVDLIWRERGRLYDAYVTSPDKLAFLATLPWIGPVTKYSLARRLGLFTAPSHRAVA